MLVKLKNLIKKRKSVSLTDLSLHFNIEKSAVESMVEMLIKKNMVIKKNINYNCNGGCKGCFIKNCQSEQIIYKWKT
jgi:predicted transcriptional regulator